MNKASEDLVCKVERTEAGFNVIAESRFKITVSCFFHNKVFNLTYAYCISKKDDKQVYAVCKLPNKIVTSLLKNILTIVSSKVFILTVH